MCFHWPCVIGFHTLFPLEDSEIYSVSLLLYLYSGKNVMRILSHVPVLAISSSAFLVKLINKQMRVKKLYMASAFIFAAIVSPLSSIIVANSTIHLDFQTVTQWCTWQQWFTWLVRSSLFSRACSCDYTVNDVWLCMSQTPLKVVRVIGTLHFDET